MKRTAGYQIRKIRPISPVRKRSAKRRDSHSRVSMPSRPEIDSNRKSGWKWALAGVVPSGGQR